MTYSETFSVLTAEYNAMTVITAQVLAAARNSGVRNGLVTVMTRHTTTGITVNEALECLESDMADFLARLVPEDHPYAHARMLRNYGSTGGNATGHLKSLLAGNHCHLRLADGEVVRGGAQDIYFFEFDGPAKRTFDVIVTGD